MTEIKIFKNKQDKRAKFNLGRQGETNFEDPCEDDD